MCLLIHSAAIFFECLLCTKHSTRPWGQSRKQIDRPRSPLSWLNGSCYYYFEVLLMFWESMESDNMASLLGEMKNQRETRHVHAEYKHHEARQPWGWGVVGTRAVCLGCWSPSGGVCGVAGFWLWQGRKAGKALLGVGWGRGAEGAGL